MRNKGNIDIVTRRKSFPRLRLFEAFVLLCGMVLFGYAYVIGSSAKTEVALPPVAEPAPPQDIDFSKFGHSNQAHARLPCLLCHRRDDNSAKMTFPGRSEHLPCASCHTAQFSDPASPICAICHTNADAGLMKKFPGLKSFGVKFDHSGHRGVNCVTCHKPDGRGAVGKSIPSGASAHTTCFQCHTSTSAAPMVSCNVCHQSGRLVRTSEWSVAFRKSFSHAKHSTGRTASCATCHTMRPGAPRGRQMSSPLVSMHFAPPQSQSCGGCHNGKKAFGPDDFDNCRRCHSPKTFKF